MWLGSVVGFGPGCVVGWKCLRGGALGVDTAGFPNAVQARALA